MVDFLKRRLQVFVSSTFSDLKEERQAAVEAILSAGHIPAGMELFAAGDESQMDVIRQWIDESDVYLLILGGRYGSVEPKTEKSYTQLEYEYALESGKPLFACVVNEAAIEGRVKANGRSVIETENPQQLKQFRADVLTRVVKFWEDTKDIKIAIAEKLSDFARREDLVGWVRPENVNVGALADEIARLSKENADLRAELKKWAAEGSGNISFDEMRKLLAAKGLLDFLERSRLQLGLNGMTASTGEQQRNCPELCILGLITTVAIGHPQRYSLTEQDAVF
ncbi:hypothetical protein ACPOL_0076 [Acidisarcina polymorpha]|uniref:EF-hand domain-containing protein n=1 Tax=Acidisarcina polymorpha TaxID=2211140 RepID=A0A2Z5FRY4_9BACT|nr:DUF4062 domain-containing protein [Acidisarcina polymorpha]AXC09463.1 hypothetical protein ACPOL_0076 [Acidisarcina polymorpha]